MTTRTRRQLARDCVAGLPPARRPIPSSRRIWTKASAPALRTASYATATPLLSFSMYTTSVGWNMVQTSPERWCGYDSHYGSVTKMRTD